MDEEKLIETVRPFPILRDLAHPRYSDAKAKERTWLQVAEKMKEPVADCKKVWKNLRESYRRAIKRRTQTTSGQAATTNRKWKFEDEMAFLSPNYEERPMLSNIVYRTAAD